MHRTELIQHLNTLLQVTAFQDYCPNGLQVEGANDIHRIVTAVTASQDAIDFAIAQNADTLLVHHGYFWKGETPSITGIKRQRLAKLLANNINVIVYHLPLDAHPELGNNAQLAQRCNFTVTERCNNGLLYVGELSKPLSGTELQQQLTQALQHPAQHIAVRQQPLYRIAWCTGAGQDLIETAAQLGVDAFISGEISERTYYQAHELNIDYFAAGHHATERDGIRMLGDYIQQKFSVEVDFFDSNNPV